MARTFHRRERLGAMSEINVTPLIDLAFALLIIFMITAPLLEQSVDINLPLEDAKPQNQSEEDNVQTVNLNGEGQIYWGGDPVSVDQLRDLLADAASKPDQPVISFRADGSLSYQQVVDIIDMIKQAKLTKLSLETRAR